MWLNKNNNEVIRKPKPMYIDGVQHPKEIFNKWTETELNAINIYTIITSGEHNRRYYDSEYVQDFIAVPPTISYTKIDKPLDEVKAKLLASLKTHKENKQNGRPAVDTGLGFSVDGGYRDLQNLEAAQSMGLTFCIDVNGVSNTILISDWDTIINAVKANGLNIIQTNILKKEEINALATVADCVLYEATPYDYVLTAEDIVDDVTSNIGDIVTRYTNNITNW